MAMSSLRPVLGEQAGYRRILIVKPSSLGDVVNALPTLAALRRRFPSSHIAWLVKRQWAGLLRRVEGVDEVWPVVPTLWGWLSQIPRLRAAGFDLVVDLQGLLRSGAVARLSGCATRIGFADGREGSPWFYTHRVAVPPMRESHAVDRNLRVAAALGAATDGAAEFSLRPTSEDRERIGTLLRETGLAQGKGRGREWIALNVSARWATKRYPEDSFAAVADLIETNGWGPVGFIGGPEDRTAVASVLARMKTRAVNLTGLTSIDLLPALLESAAVLVTNDSGPMHVAAAVGTPVVALFGPTSPVATGPYGQGHLVLQSRIPCSPCFSRRCRNEVERECLRTLSPEQVVEAVHQQQRHRVAR